jgi:hypothetical protein
LVSPGFVAGAIHPAVIDVTGAPLVDFGTGAMIEIGT